MIHLWNSICAIALTEGKIDVTKTVENPIETGLFIVLVGKLGANQRLQGKCK
jgi:hypothetical protein